MNVNHIQINLGMPITSELNDRTHIGLFAKAQ